MISRESGAQSSPTSPAGLESSEQWWRVCHVAGACDIILQDGERSAAVFGASGTGKSVALTAAHRVLAERMLVAFVDTQRWFGRLRGDASPTYLDLVLWSVSTAVQRHLEARPESVQMLSRLQREFLHWLLATKPEKRSLELWIEQRANDLLAEIFATPAPELYPERMHPDALSGQVDEMAYLAQGLGFGGVVLMLDVADPLSDVGLEVLGELFGCTELWQHPRFLIKAVLPVHVVEKADLEPKARGRIVFRRLTWNRAQHDEILLRYLQFLHAGQALAMEDFVSPAHLQPLADAVEDIFVEWSPKSAIALAGVLHEAGMRSSLPVAADEVPALLRELYCRHAPLQLDPHDGGLWRGSRFIVLTGQPFRAFKALWQTQHGDSREALEAVAGSKKRENVHTLIRRVRERVEPLKGEPIYIRRDESDTYWLDHTLRR